jgi:serine/threonine protein kinase
VVTSSTPRFTWDNHPPLGDIITRQSAQGKLSLHKRRFLCYNALCLLLPTHLAGPTPEPGFTFEEKAVSTQPRQKIGKYEIIDEIGRGGFAVVYKAHDPDLDSDVALKVLHTAYTERSDIVKRFLVEARRTAKLRHNGIVRILDVGEDQGRPFIAMEYLPGGNLAARLTGKPLPLETAVTILEQVAAALDYAHQRRLVHRDVKPANVLFDEEGHAVLADFGLVKSLVDSGMTTENTLLGTPTYMAPEQCTPGADVSPATDIYALGVVAYEMLTGRVPFQTETPLAVVHAHIYETPPDPQTVCEDLPASVAQALLKALSKAPNMRYRTAKAMVEVLRRAQVGARAAEEAPTTKPESEAKEDADTAGQSRYIEAIRAWITKHKSPPPLGWFLLGFVPTGIAVVLFKQSFHCWIEYRVSEEIVALLVVLVGMAAAAFTQIIPPNVQRVLRVPVGGVASALALGLIVLLFLVPPAKEVCFSETALPSLNVTSTPSTRSVLTSTPIATDTSTATPAKTPTVILTDTPTPTRTQAPTNTSPPPTVIPTATPTPTSTSTPTVTATPTGTPTPTPTPSPSLTSTPTRVVETPTLVATPTPTFKPTVALPQVYQAPLLLEPPSNRVFGFDKQQSINLQWWLDRDSLAADHWYEVQLWQEGEEPTGRYWTKENWWDMGPDYCPGDYSWRVVIVQGKEDDVIGAVSPPSETWHFQWLAVAPTSTEPKPTKKPSPPRP